jgi:hypothetical protein
MTLWNVHIKDKLENFLPHTFLGPSCKLFQSLQTNSDTNGIGKNRIPLKQRQQSTNNASVGALLAPLAPFSVTRNFTILVKTFPGLIKSDFQSYELRNHVIT